MTAIGFCDYCRVALQFATVKERNEWEVKHGAEHEGELTNGD